MKKHPMIEFRRMRAEGNSDDVEQLLLANAVHYKAIRAQDSLSGDAWWKQMEFLLEQQVGRVPDEPEPS